MFYSIYAKFYDRFYADKNYRQEVNFLKEIFNKFAVSPVHKILDLGCGTGGHAIPLALDGYSVTGIDQSEDMLVQAGEKSSALGVDISFRKFQIQDLNLNTTYDAVTTMYAVINYVSENKSLMEVFKRVRKHLRVGGIWVFDGWFGPAVLAQKPTVRILDINDGEDRFIRISQPQIDIINNLVHVDFSVLQIRNNKVVDDGKERHAIRYLFHPEIQFLGDQSGFEILHCCPFLNLKETPGESDWNVTWILRAI